MNSDKKLNIAWAITGADCQLKESIAMLKQIANTHHITIFLSKSAEEVLKMFNLTKEIENFKIIYEKNQGHSFPACISFMQGKYDLLIIAPCSANTLAKCSLGISDTLITTIFSHATKVALPTIILPTDYGEDILIKPRKREIKLIGRKIDKENVERVKEDKGVVVIRNAEEILWKVENIKDGKS